MSTPWVLLRGVELTSGREIELPAAEARHLTGSLRRGPGDGVVVTDGQGTVVCAEVVSAQRSRTVLGLRQVERVARSPAAPIVAVGILAGQAMDWAIQKSVEVGVERFVPVVSERSQLGSKAARGRRGHWIAVADAALKQCRRCWAMEVAEPIGLETLLREVSGGVVADPEGCGPRELRAGSPACLLVGPEGGLSDGERSRVEQSGWPRIRLGPNVLRAETAVVVGASLLAAMRRGEI